MEASTGENFLLNIIHRIAALRAININANLLLIYSLQSVKYAEILPLKYTTWVVNRMQLHCKNRPMIQVCEWDTRISNLLSTYLITLYYLINILISNDSEQLTILGFYFLNYQWPISTNEYVCVCVYIVIKQNPLNNKEYKTGGVF